MCLRFHIWHVTVPSSKANSSQYAVQLILSGSVTAQILITSINTLRYTYIKSPQQQ